MTKIAKITENTLIPISLVITIGIGIFYATVIYAKTEKPEKRIDKVELKIESQTEILLDIRDRLVRIEERNRK